MSLSAFLFFDILRGDPGSEGESEGESLKSESELFSSSSWDNAADAVIFAGLFGPTTGLFRTAATDDVGSTSSGVLPIVNSFKSESSSKVSEVGGLDFADVAAGIFTGLFRTAATDDVGDTFSVVLLVNSFKSESRSKVFEVGDPDSADVCRDSGCSGRVGDRGSCDSNFDAVITALAGWEYWESLSPASSSVPRSVVLAVPEVKSLRNSFYH